MADILDECLKAGKLQVHPLQTTGTEGLQKDAISAQLEQGAEVLKKAALHFHQKEQRHGGDNMMAIV